VDAIELLKNQHAEAKKLFDQIEKAEGAEKQDLFERLADALAVHATIEEKHFYPATNSARSEGLLQEAVEEHLTVKRLIADLLNLSPEDARFDARMTVLEEQVEHHVAEEEGELFPKVRKMLGEDELEDLGLLMEDAAEEIEAGGAPRQSLPAQAGSAAPLE
jgi:hemerythrin superfamily protein